MLFFEADAVAEEDPPDRSDPRLLLTLIEQPAVIFFQCQVGLLPNQSKQPFLMLLQGRPAVALVGLGLNAAALPPALRPADRRRIPNHNLSRSRSCRRAALNNLDHSNPQIVRIPHCRPPQSEKATESYSRLSVNPFDSQKMENALADPVILRDVKVGMKTKRQTVRMDFDQNMGELYPFSLEDKLNVITEPSSYYRKDAVSANPWGRAIIPIEMLSVLFQYRSREDRLPIKGPAVGLFADQEIRLLRGPLFAGEDYQTEREVVALSGSRRTESLWLRTTVFANDGSPVAKMLLNLASLKDSYAPYTQEYDQLYAQGA